MGERARAAGGRQPRVRRGRAARPRAGSTRWRARRRSGRGAQLDAGAVAATWPRLPAHRRRSRTPRSCTRARASPEEWDYLSRRRGRLRRLRRFDTRLCFVGHSHRPARVVARLERPGPSRPRCRCRPAARRARRRPAVPRQRGQRGPAARPRPARRLRDLGPRGARAVRSAAWPTITAPRRAKILAAGLPRPLADRLVHGVLTRRAPAPRRAARCSSSSLSGVARRARLSRDGLVAARRGSGSCPRWPSRPRPAAARRAAATAGWPAPSSSSCCCRWLDHTFRHYSAIPWPLSWLPILLLAAYCGLYVGRDRGRGRPGSRAALGAGWALARGARALGGRRVGPRLADGRLSLGPARATRSTRLPVVIQIAELAGVYGVSLSSSSRSNARSPALLALGARRACAGRRRRARSSSRRRSRSGALALGAGGRGAGRRLGAGRRDPALDRAERSSGIPRSHAEQIPTSTSASPARPRAARPALVVWPETAATIFLRGDPALLARARAARRGEVGTPLLVGSIDRPGRAPVGNS